MSIVVVDISIKALFVKQMGIEIYQLNIKIEECIKLVISSSYKEATTSTPLVAIEF